MAIPRDVMAGRNALVRTALGWALIGTAAAIVGLIGWAPLVIAADQERVMPQAQSSSPIPEIMHVRTTGWVDEIRNAIGTQQASRPGSNFDPYLTMLGSVDNALEQGDRQAVKKEMTTFFEMLAKHKGVDEDAAAELSNFAQVVTPMQEYGISVPKAAADSYGTMVIQ